MKEESWSMRDEREDRLDRISQGVDTPTGQIWTDETKGTIVPDTGWTQHYDVLKELGDCHAAVGDYENACECYDKAAVLAPDEAGPYVGGGVIALQSDKLDDAEAAFRVACRLDPNSSKAWCGLAMVSQRRDKHSHALKLYLKSLELNCDDLTALLGLFQVSCRMGSFSTVIHYLKVYLDLHPGDTSVMFCLATLQLKDGNLFEAGCLLEKIIAIEPDNIDAVNLMEEVEHAQAQKIGTA